MSAPRCELCHGTGFVQRGMVVAPFGSDSYVDWVSKLVACSHPETPGTVPGEPTHRTVLVGSRRPEGREGTDRAAQADGPSPVSGGAA